MIPPEGNIASDSLQHAHFAAQLRRLLLSANDHFGGINWSLPALYLVHKKYTEVMQQYVRINNPSAFKRCAGFALAFMDPVSYPIYGEFEQHKFQKDIQHIPRHSGAVLVYEYVRYCLTGAILNREDGTTVMLSNPIAVSKHTFVDLVHALALLDNNSAASFHLTALLFEQLAYRQNDAAYPAVI